MYDELNRLTFAELYHAYARTQDPHREQAITALVAKRLADADDCKPDADHLDAASDFLNGEDPERYTGNLWQDPYIWLSRQFEFELCPECGKDAADHTAIPLMGSWFARCNCPPSE
jgi:hypothetical protein